MFVFYLVGGAAGLAVREQRLVAVNGRKWYGYFSILFEFDLVWTDFYLFVFDFEHPIFVTDSYPNAQKLYFYDVDIHYNFIRQKVTLFVSDSAFEYKYKNKYDISDIRIRSIFIPIQGTPRRPARRSSRPSARSSTKAPATTSKQSGRTNRPHAHWIGVM